MDTDALAAKIILDISGALKKNITEYDIIPLEEQHVNKSPVVVVDDKLAIESWCVKYVYLYANERFLRRRRDSVEENKELGDITRILLLINPEYLSAWNARKLLVIQGIIDIKDELSFSYLLLVKKPKSCDIFCHRRYLITRLFQTPSQSIDLIQVVKNELKLCSVTADKYARNYYSWSHRYWVVTFLTSVSTSNGIVSEIIREELSFTREWIPSHVSDFGAIHYRQVLLSLYFNTIPPSCQPSTSNQESMQMLLIQETKYLDTLMETFPDRESLFLHRRFILQKHLTIWQRGQESGNDYQQVLQKEKEFLITSDQRAANNTYQQNLLRRHRLWLKRCLGDQIHMKES